ncbi:hypothetical protein PC9H_007371 [Pleurotus ostreatus]|uniref:RRM domain-containing protein n=2 Tax=Pleurotus ostreatus TaxID=5322 RepID=A0A067NKR4_PLEO1|nr:uncharacterized protein PC9H_007371 [Pleurotus ostreatus]KAF7428151.1 hypothetical protein PC9H_007371 [Pleurotus ostreatus]KDQ27620.1 hypothetical protein PLEOSDRAFT_1076728 [Pleurotus ostreatus PC15]
MASLLERLSVPQPTGPGPIRSRNSQSRSSTPYNRPPKRDVDSPWSHDLFEQHNSLSARLNLTPSAPKTTITSIAQKALRDATSKSSGELNIKGAGSQNVVEVTGLVDGTTADDVAAIFKRCGTVTNTKAVPGGETKIRVTFKEPASATAAVQKFNGQVADGKVLSVRIVGATATTLGGRLGGVDGLGLVRQEGSVDVLMGTQEGGSKMRSDSLLKADPRAQVLVAPPGTNPADYVSAPGQRGGRRGRGGRGGRGRRGGGRGGNSNKMDLD